MCFFTSVLRQKLLQVNTTCVVFSDNKHYPLSCAGIPQTPKDFRGSLLPTQDLGPWRNSEHPARDDCGETRTLGTVIKSHVHFRLCYTIMRPTCIRYTYYSSLSESNRSLGPKQYTRFELAPSAWRAGMLPLTPVLQYFTLLQGLEPWTTWLTARCSTN